MKRNDEKPTPKLGIEGGHWGLEKNRRQNRNKIRQKNAKMNRVQYR